MNLGDLEFKDTWNPKYEVSRCGLIRNKKTMRILKAANDGRGYKVVTLCSGPQRDSVRVHRAVAFAFLGLRPPKTEINHKNGIKFDNRAENLEYVTVKQNRLHALAIGLKSKTPNRKLTSEQIAYIRLNWVGGLSEAKKLARKLKVSWSTLYKLRAGSIWN